MILKSLKLQENACHGLKNLCNHWYVLAIFLKAKPQKFDSYHTENDTVLFDLCQYFICKQNFHQNQGQFVRHL